MRAFDPAAMDEARRELDGVHWCADPYDAMAGAHALVIVTEWNAFRALDLARAKALMAAPVMVDLRNIYRPADVIEAGFSYVGVGRAKLAAQPD